MSTPNYYLAVMKNGDGLAVSTTGLNQASLLNHATKSIFRVKEHASMGFISMSLANSVCELRCELHS
jgi:hypothetical protein